MESEDINKEGKNKKEEIKKFLKELDKKKEGDTYSYKGWMNSDSFLKRTAGIFLYALGGYILFVIFFVIVAVLIALLFRLGGS